MARYARRCFGTFQYSYKLDVLSTHDGFVYGQKDREFEPYFSLPRQVHEPMEIAANAPLAIRQRLAVGGWRLVDPLGVTKDPWTYQDYLARSRAEFCVAKHGYVSTQCGWFSDRSSAYLALSRPVVIQDTGFSHFLPCGDGLLTFARSARRSQLSNLFAGITSVTAVPPVRWSKRISTREGYCPNFLNGAFRLGQFSHSWEIAQPHRSTKFKWERSMDNEL